MKPSHAMYFSTLLPTTLEQLKINNINIGQLYTECDPAYYASPFLFAPHILSL